MSFEIIVLCLDLFKQEDAVALSIFLVTGSDNARMSGGFLECFLLGHRHTTELIAGSC